MGLVDRIGRPGRVALLLAVGAAGGGAALAVASVPDGNGVIHACYRVTSVGSTVPVTTAGNLRVIDPSAGEACTTTSDVAGAPGPVERPLDWNTAGPQGATGPQGPAGKSITVAGGHTLTLSGGDVITVSGGNGITLPSPTFRGTERPVGKLDLGTGSTGLASDILGFSLASSHGAGGGGGAGKVAVHDISITKTRDKSSPKLFLACANGKHFPKASITLRKAGRLFQKITLSDVLVSSYQSGGHGSVIPTETFTLNFTKITYQYKQQ